MSEIRKGTLGDILSASQIITADDISAALEEQKRAGCRFGEALVNLGIVTQEDIDWALSNQLDIPYIRLKQEMIDPAAIALIPAAMARLHNCIPLIRAGGELNIALADPLNRPAIEAVERQSGCSVNVSVALIREIREMIDAFYGSEELDSLGFSSPVFPEKALETINADLSGGSLLDYLLIFSLQNRLTSLSLQPLGDVVQISAKRGGLTSVLGALAPGHYPEFSLRLRKAASIHTSAGTSAGGRYSFSHRSRTEEFQISIMQGEGGDYITIRLHSDAQIPNRLVELHLPPAQESAFALLARAGQGITFFASRNPRERDGFMDLMLEEMATSGRNVIILGEGPGRLQKRFPRIPLPESGAQRARLIMDSLDHDPDILVIDDVIDGPAFSAACRAAMHGKLVLAGLDIRGTRSAFDYLLQSRQKNCFLPVFVNGLVSFSAIQLLCPACRADYSPTPRELAAMQLEPPLPAFYRAAGCEDCGQRGFSERRFLLDVIPFDEEFLRVFEQAGNLAALDNWLKLAGRHGIEHEGLRLLTAGEVAPEEYIASIIM